MLKAALAGTAALAIVGSSFVYAQERGRPGGFERPQSTERSRPTLDDMRAFADARLAALHAGLGLTPDQEKSWPAFEQAAREMAKLRLDRFAAAANTRRDRAPQQQSDPADRMHRRAAVMTETGTTLKKVADAMDPLYKSLDDGQKRRFAMLEQMLRPRDEGQQSREFRGRDGERGRDGSERDRSDRGRDGYERGRDGSERGRDGRDDGQRRFDARPRRTDLSPQAPGGSEQKL
jgi:LTXXQ motif family protein